MKRFTQLIAALEDTTSTLEKIAHIEKYFRDAPEKDSKWGLSILLSQSRSRAFTSSELRKIFVANATIPEWMYVECHAQVGDTAETISLLKNYLRPNESSAAEASLDLPLHVWMTEKIPLLRELADPAPLIVEMWRRRDAQEVFTLNKILAGGFRIGVSNRLVIKALSNVLGISFEILTHRLMGEWNAEHFEISDLKNQLELFADLQPYPFCLAQEFDLEKQGFEHSPRDFYFEYKLDGIRAQIVKRSRQLGIWSRGEDLIQQSFPDLEKQFSFIPDGTVLDGEIVILKNGQIESFQSLQQRLGRKKVSDKVMRELPAGFVAYDCLEFKGQDIRTRPLLERKASMDQVLEIAGSSQIQKSREVVLETWDQLEQLRRDPTLTAAEGLMVKRRDAPYLVGRKVGAWWKWKRDPLTLDGVLIYAQAGSGRRANLFTDYTFALRGADGSTELVPFAKAYSGLDQKEIDELDRWVRKNTREKFGPVRSVKPFHVFEIGFEGISRSKRHKSGIAVRFPRILRWRRDKPAEQASDLSEALALIEKFEPSSRKDSELATSQDTAGLAEQIAFPMKTQTSVDDAVARF